MLVDMHLHECTYSSDSKISLEEIVSIAEAGDWTLSASRTMTAWDSGNMQQNIHTGPVSPFLWVLSSFPFRGISRRGGLKIIPAAGWMPRNL